MLSSVWVEKMKTKLAQRLMVLISTLLLMLPLSGNLWAAAKSDLLFHPSVEKKDLIHQVYMDVVSAGSRIVAVGELGVIAYSDDQGQNWQQAKVPTSVTLTAVYFPTSQQGWAVGHDGVVLHSSDAGLTWQKQLDGNLVNTLTLAATKNVVVALERRIAVASDEQLVELERDMEELGYQLADAENAIAAGPVNPFMDVWFADEHQGLIVGAFGMIFRTEDGGNKWKALNTAIDNPDGFHYYGLAQTKTALLLIGEAGLMFRSFDQGRSWETLTSPYEGPMFGIGADLTNDQAIAVGLRGKIVIMEANGDNLELVETVVPVALNTGIKRSDGSWLLAGLAGQLLVQTSKGDSFALLKARFSACMSIVETADKHLVLAGLRGLKRIDNTSIK
jgi:photosystem II stability/assembly factor-like uncharacterized protein